MKDITTGVRLCERESKLRSDRSSWEDLWEELTSLILPRASDFRSETTQGQEKTRVTANDVAPLSNIRFASALSSIIAPANNRWHTIEFADDEVNQKREVKLWCDKARAALFRMRYRQKANFANQFNEALLHIGAIGTGVMYIEHIPGEGARYRHLHVHDVVFDVDFTGRPDCFYRTFKLTPRQAVQMFGEDTPKEILKFVEEGKDEKLDFLHAVEPRSPELVSNTPLRTGKEKPFASYYVYKATKEVIREGGYNTNPYQAGRYAVALCELYGRGPGQSVLPSIRELNTFSREQVRAASQLARPSLLAADDSVLGFGNRRVNMRPHGITYGGISPEGRPLIAPLNTGARPDIIGGLMERPEMAIKDAFLVTLFQILTENPRMTATEALIRLQEKGQLIAPNAARIQSELIAPMIERELDIAIQEGLIDTPPESVRNLDYEVVFTAPVNKMLEAQDSLALQNTLTTLAPFIESDPSILGTMFDPIAIAKGVSYANDLPAKWLVDEQKAKQGLEQSQEGAAEQMGVQNDVQASQAMLNTAKANQIAQGG